MLYLLIIILGAIGSLVGPWWALPLVACLICALKAKTPGQAFGVSSAAAVTLWTVYSLILVFSGKENLVDKIGTLFAGNSAFLAHVPSLGLILTIVTLVAGLTTGFAGLAGKHLRMMFS
ncbi:MAG: hypothetical protein KF870_11125 [Leadbetterella sp.]|nr:hypothetical protein [Leadbetterella sp.]